MNVQSRPQRILFALIAFLALAQRIGFAQDDQALQQLQQRVTSTVQRAGKSVVAVARVPKGEATGAFQIPSVGILGSRVDEAVPTDADFVPADFAAGVVIDRQGLILTTYHVIGKVEASNYYVWSQHRPFRATVVAADGWFDLAVLKVDRHDLEPIQFGNTKSLAKGQFVIAMGNPDAVGRDGEASAASGIIANLARRAPRVPERSTDPAGRETIHHYGSLIQTDMELSVGFDGGALMNLDGEMIGVNTAYSAGPDKPKSAGFAIPVDEYFLAALEKLKAGKSADFGFLGVRPRPLELKFRQEGQRGALVEAVEPDTPAARAEIRPGDVIVTADQQVLADDDDLIRVIGSLPAGRTVELTVFRGDPASKKGETLNMKVPLAKKAVSTLRRPYATVPPPSWRGMTVDFSSAAPRQALVAARLPSEGSQVLHIVEVQDATPAFLGGVRSNMFLVKVGDRTVTTPDEFFAAVRDAQGDVTLHLLDTKGTQVIHTVSP